MKEENDLNSEQEERDLSIKSLLKEGLSVLFVGINPSASPVKGLENHFFGGQSNLFWPLLSDSGILPYNAYSALDDRWLFKYYDVGFTNFVPRATSTSEEIRCSEYAKGLWKLRANIALYKPKVIVFVGTTIYSIFNQKFSIGLRWGPQANYIYQSGNGLDGCLVFALPSTSRRGLTYPPKEKKKAFLKLREFLEKNNITISIR